jgi:hypothetical protein
MVNSGKRNRCELMLTIPRSIRENHILGQLLKHSCEVCTVYYVLYIRCRDFFLWLVGHSAILFSTLTNVMHAKHLPQRGCNANARVALSRRRENEQTLISNQPKMAKMLQLMHEANEV